MMDLGGGFWEWIRQLGGWGAAAILVGFFVWLVLGGRLFSRYYLDQLRQTNTDLAAALKEYEKSWPKVLEYMQTADKFFRELQDQRDRGGGGSP